MKKLGVWGALHEEMVQFVFHGTFAPRHFSGHVFEIPPPVVEHGRGIVGDMLHEHSFVHEAFARVLRVADWHESAVLVTGGVGSARAFLGACSIGSKYILGNIGVGVYVLEHRQAQVFLGLC